MNYHACLETLGGSGADVSSGKTIASIKNYAGADSFTSGQKYGRGFVTFESAELSTPSGNTANLVVITSRYDKRKNQISVRIKKTYQLTLVGNVGSLEGCYLKDANNSVTKSTKQICQSIEGMVWSGGECKLGPFLNKECPSGKALSEINSAGSFQCCDVKWNPNPADWCTGETLIQKTGCQGQRTATGSKTSSWSPSPSTVCRGTSFTQTEQCCRGATTCFHNTRPATGTKCCLTCSGNFTLNISSCTCDCNFTCHSGHTLDANSCICNAPVTPLTPVTPLPSTPQCPGSPAGDPGDPCDTSDPKKKYDGNCNCIKSQFQCTSGVVPGNPGDICGNPLGGNIKNLSPHNVIQKYDSNCNCTCNLSLLGFFLSQKKYDF